MKPFGQTGSTTALVKTAKANQPKLWTKDSKRLLYHQFEERKGCDIYILNIDDMNTEPFLTEDYNEGKPDFSPDNNWLAYESDETGNFEVYITDFPEKRHKVQVSISGGYEPLWSHSGNKVFYRYNRDFYSVKISFDDNKNIILGKPELLFSGEFKLVDSWGRSYDLSPAEDAFVMVREIEDNAVRSINVVSDIFTEIRIQENKK
jgi:Tol biopolymer transport system component